MEGREREQLGTPPLERKLLSVDNIAYNILFENTFHSNLVPDISKVDYLAGNLGPTDLQPLEGVGPFVDDMYIFGYCRKEQMECSGRRIWYKKSTGAAATVVRSIAGVLASSIYADKKYHVSIQNTTRTDTIGTICNTIRKIEEATDGKTRKRWLVANNIGEAYTERLEDQKAIVGVFVAKVDLSEYSMQETKEFLPRIQEFLDGSAYGIFSIDYTHDFSGTLDRNKLVEYFLSIGCREQGDKTEKVQESFATILDNTKSVGNRVCTLAHEYNGLFVRRKIYNKIPCQFEAGTVQQTFGGHLADYAACPNKHLRKTFEHPDVRARGVSRIEISVYGCCTGDPLEYGRHILAETIQEIQGKDLFCIQPSANHWENFAKAIDRCCMFVDRPKKVVHFCWYGHSTTRKLGGVVVPIGKKDIDRVARACIAEFGFRSCPIFRIDFLGRVESIGGTKQDIFSPLRCYTKPEDSKTVLCPSKKPTKKYEGEQDPSLVLFPTKHIHWMWKEKTTRLGTGKEDTFVQEIPTTREISNIGCRERENMYNLLEEEKREREWCEENIPRVDTLVAERRQEIQRIEVLQEEAKERVHLLEEYSYNVRGALRNRIEKVHEIEDLPKEFHVLGYRQTHGTLYGSGKIYVLQEEKKDDLSTIPFPVWATKRLDAILRDQNSMPDTKKTKDVRVYIDFGGTKKIQISILEKKPFRTRDGVDRFFCPIDVLEIPKLLDISLVDKEVEKMYKTMDPPKEQRLCYRETLSKERKTKLADFAEGEYVCYEYSSFEYRGKTRYVLFLGEEGRSATGFWIDEEMCKIVDELPFAPMLCKVGKMARTRNGHKGRKIVFCIAKENWETPTISPSKEEQPTFQSKGEQPTFQSKGEQPTFQSKGEQPTFQSKGEQPTFQSKGEQPTFQSKEEQPTFQSKGELCKVGLLLSFSPIREK